RLEPTVVAERQRSQHVQHVTVDVRMLGEDHVVHFEGRREVGDEFTAYATVPHVPDLSPESQALVHVTLRRHVIARAEGAAAESGRHPTGARLSSRWLARSRRWSRRRGRRRSLAWLLDNRRRRRRRWRGASRFRNHWRRACDLAEQG